MKTMKTIGTFIFVMLFAIMSSAQAEIEKQSVQSVDSKTERENEIREVISKTAGEVTLLALSVDNPVTLPIDSMMLELTELEGSHFVDVKFSGVESLNEADLYALGESDAQQKYEGDKESGKAALVGTSLLLPIGIISSLDQSSAKKNVSFAEVKDPFLRSNPAYMKGFSDQAHKMRKKAVKKNFLIGLGIQSVVAVGVGALILNSSGNPRVGMSGL